MIALCGEHHDKADSGAYTKDQLRRYKREGSERADDVKGRFDWMRHDLLTVAGGNFFYETPVVLRFRGENSIWLKRDEEGYWMLNVRMLSTVKEPRTRIEDNFWLSRGTPEDLVSPPSGKLLHVKYPNGDMLRVEFFVLDSAKALCHRYPDARPENWDLPFPITSVEVRNRVGGTDVDFGPRQMKWQDIAFRGNFASHCEAGIDIT